MSHPQPTTFDLHQLNRWWQPPFGNFGTWEHFKGMSLCQYHCNALDRPGQVSSWLVIWWKAKLFLLRQNHCSLSRQKAIKKWLWSKTETFENLASVVLVGNWQGSDDPTFDNIRQSWDMLPAMWQQVWYSVVWYCMVWYGAYYVEAGVVWYSIVWYSMVMWCLLHSSRCGQLAVY